MTITRPDHWNHHARQWQHVGPPLRPAREDVALFETLATESLRGRAGLAGDVRSRAVLLGVTPELASMRWPAGTRLTSVDRCAAMIETWWPADRVPPGAEVVCGEWRQIPADDRSVDLVVGDGCYTLLNSPEGYEAVTREIHRILRPGGRLVMRYFARPERPESTSAVFADLLRGRVGNFHVLKWRLAMSLHGTLDKGVCVADVWDAWNDRVPDPAKLARDLRWPREAVATIDAYRGVPTRYTFPTLPEIRASLADRFVEESIHFPAYELGDRCPTIYGTAR
jgi:SAM-dependent methyltransferase